MLDAAETKSLLRANGVRRFYRADGTIEHFVSDDSAKASWKAYSTGTANDAAGPFSMVWLDEIRYESIPANIWLRVTGPWLSR